AVQPVTVAEAPAALRIDLHQLPFDLGQRLTQRGRRSSDLSPFLDPAVGRTRRRGRRPSLELTLQLADRVDARVQVRQPAPDPLGVLIPHFHVGLCGRVPRVLSDLEGNDLNLVAELEADPVAPGRHEWPRWERVPPLFLRRVDLDRPGWRMPPVPHEPIQALAARGPRFLWTPRLWLFVLVARCRAEASDLLAGRVEEGQPELAVARVAEPEQDGYPVRAVLTRLDRDGIAFVAVRPEPHVVGDDDHPGPAVPTACAGQVAEGDAPGVLDVPARLVQVHRLSFLTRVVLPYRRQVVEDPDRPAVGRGHQVVALDDQVMHRCQREVAAQRAPGGTPVE